MAKKKPEAEIESTSVVVTPLPLPAMDGAAPGADAPAQGELFPELSHPTPPIVGVSDVSWNDITHVVYKTGEHHPAHPLLDQIEIMAAFCHVEAHHTICDLAKKIRAML